MGITLIKRPSVALRMRLGGHFIKGHVDSHKDKGCARTLPGRQAHDYTKMDAETARLRLIGRWQASQSSRAVVVSGLLESVFMACVWCVERVRERGFRERMRGACT